MANAALREKHAPILRAYENNLDAFELFHKHVRNFFEAKSLAKHVHSVRHRVKDVDHLLEKIERKNAEDAALPSAERKGEISADNVFTPSIHYVLRPNSRSQATCEVQVRTLIEEVWGEVDHTMNYPTPTADEHCREQIRVLARLVGAGTHLADSIMRRYTHAQ